MKSRESNVKRPCVYCETPTLFLRDVRGKRGALLRWEDCCPDCGERPARRLSPDSAASTTAEGPDSSGEGETRAGRVRATPFEIDKFRATVLRELSSDEAA